MKIILNNNQMARCVEFSNKCAKQQQQIEFGQTDTGKRNFEEIARDNLIGKIAEVAFSKFLEDNYDISVSLDFNYYPRKEWDDEDVIINGWKIDVKGTRQGGKWLLVEWNKLSFRKAENKLPHLFVMNSVGWDRIDDKPTGIVELKGFFSTNRLTGADKRVYVLRKGSTIPGTNCRLQADNYGVPFKNLFYNWDWLIDKFENSQPFSLSNFEIC